MSLGLSLIHLLNFLAPALFLALALPVLEAIFNKKWPPSFDFLAQAAIYFIAATTVLTLGLMCLARDGKMLTYTALAGVAALVLAWRTRSR